MVAKLILKGSVFLTSKNSKASLMKNKSPILSLAGLLLILAKPFLTAKLPGINPADSQYPMTNIPGTVPPQWPFFAGAILIAISMIFYFTRDKPIIDKDSVLCPSKTFR